MSGIDTRTILYLRGDKFEDLSLNYKSVENMDATIVEDEVFGKCVELGVSKYLKVINGMKGIDYSKDFTFEWWEYSTGASVSNSGLFTNRIATVSSSGSSMLLGYGGTIIYAGNNPTSWNGISGAIFKDKVNGTWVHWALVKKDSVWTTYKNGNVFWSVTNATVTGKTDGDNCTIGAWVDNSIRTGYNALIRDFRVSNYAVYKENFTPRTNHYNSISINILNQTQSKIIFNISKLSPKEKINRVEVVLNGDVQEVYTSNFGDLSYNINYSNCIIGENNLVIRVIYDDIYTEEKSIILTVGHEELPVLSNLNEVMNRFKILDNSIESEKSKLIDTLNRKNLVASKEEGLSTLIQRVNLLKEIPIVATLDESYLNANGSFLNHTKTIIVGHNNTAGFAITGTQNSSSTANYMNGRLRYDLKIDFTNISKVSFYARKVANHGVLGVYISDGLLGVMDASMTYHAKLWVHYNNLPTVWTQYSIDTSNITGTRTISFVGGYIDNTGYTTSQTQYSNIELYYET